ncbi:hypothetical protein RhiirB3_455027 [Rhizophagus irregularis]|nr:hypothetical protein RhiirB3_455027 [Rhizophagus irregularis]
MFFVIFVTNSYFKPSIDNIRTQQATYGILFYFNILWAACHIFGACSREKKDDMRNHQRNMRKEG